MFNILIPQGCRSDTGLSDPIIKRLQKEKWCNIKVIQLEPQNFISSYQLTDISCKANNYIGIYDQEKPRILLATGDRVEMCAAACAAFHNKIPIAHFYAGIVNDPITTFDDIDRHCITLWSDIQFVESGDAFDFVSDEYDKYELGSKDGLLSLIGKKPNCHIVGISHMDDILVDESLVPLMRGDDNPHFMVTLPYDLILINREPLGKNIFDAHIQKERTVIQIGGNPDGITKKALYIDKYYDNLPRPQFLGLLKNCQRFISNSSAAIYEAPHFLKPEQIIMVGDRNKNRPRGPFQTGASDRIVEILREYLK